MWDQPNLSALLLRSSIQPSVYPKFYPFGIHRLSATPTTDLTASANFTALVLSNRSLKMSPKRIVVERSAPRGAPKGFFGSTYSILTSSENAAVVRSIGLFGVSPARNLAHSGNSSLTSSNRPP